MQVKVKTELAKVPINGQLQFELIECGEGAAEISMPVQPWFEQEGGVIHGGIITSLADTTAVYGIHPFLKAGEAMTSIELKINFVRPGRLSGGNLIAKSTTVRRGGTIALCDVEVSQNASLIAKGLFTYLIMKKRE